LPSPCHRATPFAALSESQEGSHALPGVSPPRVSCIFARPCLRCAGLLAGSSRRHSSRVLADSSNWDLVTVTVFPPQVETPRGFSLGQQTASDRRQPPRSMFAYTGCVRPQAVGTGERFAPVRRQIWERNPREPGAPTAPDFSPVTRNHLGVTRQWPCGPRSFALVLSKNCEESAKNALNRQ
jgi:hypothetical protein